MNREKIDPSIMLHKLIDENKEAEAIKLIEENMNDIDINYEFNSRIPVFSAMGSNMFSLLAKIINHPKFEADIEDCFGDTLLQSILYIYSAEELLPSEEQNLFKVIDIILDSNAFDLNAQDLGGDTALTIACEYPKMNSVTKKLIANKIVDVNLANGFSLDPLTVSISNKNLEIIEELGKRPDLVVTDAHFKAATKNGINLKEYISPDKNMFGSEYEGMESLNEEMESLISELTAAVSAVR
jgi:ankyrin repeat protein